MNRKKQQLHFKPQILLWDQIVEVDCDFCCHLKSADTCHLVGLLMDNMLPRLVDLVDVLKKNMFLSVYFKDIRVLLTPFDF